MFMVNYLFKTHFLEFILNNAMRSRSFSNFFRSYVHKVKMSLSKQILVNKQMLPLEILRVELLKA